MASEFIKKVVLYGAIAFTIKLVAEYDSTAGWLYVAVLLMGYLYSDQTRVQRLQEFTAVVTEGA